VSEQKHLFMRLRYVKENGLPGFYSPTSGSHPRESSPETKAQDMLTKADLVRKQRAAVAWCERVNELPPEQRSDRTWSYCLLGEACFNSSATKAAR